MIESVATERILFPLGIILFLTALLILLRFFQSLALRPAGDLLEFLLLEDSMEGRFRSFQALTLSLSLHDLWRLARSETEQFDNIKRFYEWKHDSLSLVMKSILVFLLGQLGLAIKIYSSPGGMTSLKTFATLSDFTLFLVAALSLLVLIEIYLLIAIRTVPLEHLEAVHIYNLFRGDKWG